METRNDDMEDLFRKSFENFEQEPPEELKALIDKQLQFKTKRGFGRIWYLGILGIILAVSTLAYFSLSKVGTQKRIEIAKNNASTQQKDTDAYNNKSELKNNSSQSTHPNSIHSTLKDSSSNTKTKYDNIKNKEIKDQKKLNNKDNFQTKASEEKSTLNSSQKASRFNKNLFKNQKGKSKKTRNSQNSNKVFLNQDLAVQNEVKSQEVNRRDDDIAVKNKLSIEENPKTEEVKKDNNLSAKKDSTSNSLASKEVKDSTQTQDSSQVIKPNDDGNNAPKTSPFLFAFKTDYLLPFGKQEENDIKFSTNNAFHFQAEVSYLLRSSIGVNSGINYFSSSQSFSKTTTSVDSTFTGITFQPIYEDSIAYVYDSNNMIIDSFLVSFIVDSIETANYDVKNISSTQSSSFTISSFSIPLLFYYNQKLAPNLSLDIMTGGVFSFQQIKFRDASNPLNSDLSINKFGVKALLKTSLRYQFNHFGVSLNNTLMYDLKPVQYQNTKYRKMSYGFGIGLFWKM